MARTPSTLPGGPRLSDYLSLGVIAQVFPMPAVLTALEQSKSTSIRRRRLPAEVMVYYVLTLCQNLTLFFSEKSTDIPHYLGEFFKNDVVQEPIEGVSFGLMNRINTET